MTLIYDVILKRHVGSARPDVCIFYDEDKEKAIKEIGKYRKANGFSIKEKDGVFAIATIMLRERKPTGEVLHEWKYHELFDTVTGKRKKVE